MSRDLSHSGILAVRGRSFESVGRIVDSLPGVRRRDLSPGDRLIVETKNSVYSIWAWSSFRFVVSGGWYDKMGQSPKTVGINGCTLGGSAICSEIIAAPGLFLEFQDVKTTRIRKVTVIKATESRADH